MRSRLVNAKNFYAALLCSVASQPLAAQSITLPPAPLRSSVDERGVDAATGGVQMSDPQLSIGTASNGLVHTRYWPGNNGWRHGYMISAKVDSSTHVTVSIGGSSTGFTLSGGVYSSDQGDGSSLVDNGTSSFTYTGRDGTTIYFDKTLAASNASYGGAVDAVGTVITPPTGLKTYLTYKRSSYQVSIPLGGFITFWVVRLQSVTTSTGFQLKYSYANNTLSAATVDDWVRMGNVAAINNAVDYCDPTADTCTGFSQTWPYVSYSIAAAGSGTIETVTSLVTTSPTVTTRSKYYITVAAGGAGKLTGIRRPSSPSADNVTYGYDTNSRVNSVAVAGVGTWAYNFSLSGSTLTGTITTPSIPTPRYIYSDTTVLQPTQITDENGYTSTFTYDTNGRLKTAVHPEGNFLTYSYDSRGNLYQTVATPKSGSGLGTLTTSAVFPSSCTNAATCNQPTTTTDVAGNVTNYFYNSNGTLDYVQAPAPTSGAARPEVHYGYTGPLQAWFKNSSGTVTNTGHDAVNLPTTTTTCVTGAWPCSTANQVVTELDYYGGPSATNLLVQYSTVKSGTGSPSSTTTYAYDNIGNVTSVTDPVGNVTPFYYAADRQSLGYRSPSLDGLPNSIRPAVVIHYNSDGLRDSTGYGSVDPSTSVFTPRRYEIFEYDSAGRKTVDGLTDGSLTYFAKTQYSYNGAGRLDCTAQRMNPATFGSLPSSACTLGTAGSYGDDRITHYVWEYAGLLGYTQSGYGTTSQRTDVSYIHTLNGQVATMTDAKGNVTSYNYDGHDRLLRTCYNTALASCSDTAPDIVKLTYDSVGHLTNRGLRGHSLAITIGYTYDNLGRPTHIAYPGGGFYDQPVDLYYDNLGRLTNAIDANTHAANYVYDALGNVTTQSDSVGARTMTYDAAGKRTQLTWAADGRYVTYGYDGASNLKTIKESGTTALATFGYDDVGRRNLLTLGNGVTTSYAYNPLGVTSLTYDLAGTANDLTLGFSYNPAGQIVTKTSSNDSYAWTGSVNVNRNYSANGLNQYTAAGTITPTYDIKQNLSAAGGTASYNYSTKNELVSRNDTSKGFYHDPLGRLDDVIGSSQGFQYDGEHISTEILDASPFTIQRRYVWGPGADEPLIWYEGADFSNKRYLVADERGSIIAATDSSGNIVEKYSYDEYGIPGSMSYAGRFQYTGQAWIPELGMYSYKARIYSPTLGRFLQPDPAGYPDGPNNYNYAVSDPVNGTDPSGMNPFDDADDIVVNAPGCGLGCTIYFPGPDGFDGNNLAPPPVDFGGVPGADVPGQAQPAPSPNDIVVNARKSNVKPEAPASGSVVNTGGDGTPPPGTGGDIVVTARHRDPYHVPGAINGRQVPLPGGIQFASNEMMLPFTLANKRTRPLNDEERERLKKDLSTLMDGIGCTGGIAAAIFTDGAADVIDPLLLATTLHDCVGFSLDVGDLTGIN